MVEANRRVAVVTGGSRGIGRSIAMRLAHDGLDVMLTYRTEAEAADGVVAEIAAHGGNARAVRVDLADLSQLQAAFEATQTAFGHIDVVVHNAAGCHVAPIDAVDERTFDRVFMVHAKAAFFTVQNAARCLRDRGRLIGISTLSTQMSEPGIALYAASKAALEQFIRAAAWELGARGITANIVSPGPTNTDLLRSNNPPEVIATGAQMSPLGRIAEPTDIAQIVAFLASPRAAWITGQNLAATGGPGLLTPTPQVRPLP